MEALAGHPNGLLDLDLAFLMQVFEFRAGGDISQLSFNRFHSQLSPLILYWGHRVGRERRFDGCRV